MNADKFPLLITGAAGFIGHALLCRLLTILNKTLLKKSLSLVVGIDNFNPYYSVALKKARIAHIENLITKRSEKSSEENIYSIVEGDLTDTALMRSLFQTYKFKTVIHLGAQAGVRHSLNEPMSYVQSNIVGTLNILENCRHFGINHLIYASTSSVYGGNNNPPFNEEMATSQPLSLYSATKEACELMVQSYYHLFNIRATGLRFFTVYGPWGRPDMALFRFTERIIKGEPIDVYDEGRSLRDWTYIDDVIDGILKALTNSPEDHCKKNRHPIYNLGSGAAVPLLQMIETLENALGLQARKKMLPYQKGDMEITCANIEKAKAHLGYTPSVSLGVGIEHFVNWYKKFYLNN